MDEVADDLLHTLYIVEAMHKYLEKAWKDDAKTPKEQLGWRTLNAIQKGVNRRLPDDRRASLGYLRAVIQIEMAGANIEQETVSYPLRPDSQTFYRLTGMYWLHKFAPNWEVTNLDDEA